MPLIESPILNFAGPDAPFLGLEWPLMPPLAFPTQDQMTEASGSENILNPDALTMESAFGLLGQDDVGIDPDLLTLRPPRCPSDRDL